MKEEQYTVFKLLEEEYAVSVFQIKEIIHPQPITRIPGMPNYFKGVINLRDKILPVMSLSSKFRLPVSTSEDKNIIIVGNEKRDEEKEIGIIVDQVIEVIYLQETDIHSMPLELENKNRYIKGIANISGRLITLLDFTALVEEENLK